MHSHSIEFHRFSDRLKDVNAEARYRESSLSTDISHVRLYLFIASVAIVLAVLFDGFALIQNDPLVTTSYSMIAIRVFFIALGFAIIFWSHHLKHYQSFERLMSIWLYVVTLVVIIDQYSHPSDFVGNLYLIVFFINYMLIPIPVRLQAMPTTLLVLVLLWLVFAYKEPTYPAENFFAALTAVILNFLGFVASLMYGRTRRTNFIHIEKERSLREELEKTHAGLKILSGFLPICSNCMKIRDDDGEWERTDTYISKHADVEFTHSICPCCSEKLYDFTPKSK